MANYADWLEETIGFTEEDFSLGENVEAKDSDSYGGLPYTFERDAVLCLVDCRREMFALPIQPQHSPVLLNQTIEHSFKGDERTLSTSLTSSCRDFDTCRQDAVSTPLQLTGFVQALRGVSYLYRNKSVSGDCDIVALVLYNTAVTKNNYGCSGVYIFHPFSPLDLSSMHAVEQLAAAAASPDPGSAAYMELIREIGHLPSHQPPALKEALRAAHCMFLGLSTKASNHKRIFVFTNEDDPTRGSALERDLCITLSYGLADMGVVIEVFGVGVQAVGAAAPPSAATTVTVVDVEGECDTTTSDGILANTNGMEIEPLVQKDVFFQKGNVSFTKKVDSATFSGGSFWERLIHEMDERRLHKGSPNTAGLTFSSGGCHTNYPARTVGIGGSLGSSFEGFLESIRRKIHPQRPFLNCSLWIGARADGGDVPHMAVSLFSPLLPASGQSTGWIETTTNAPVNRRVVLKVKRADSIIRGGGNDGERPHLDEVEHRLEGCGERDDGLTGEQDTIISPEEVCYSTQIGGTAIVLTRAERAKLAAAASAGVAHGLTIVCFKQYEDVIQHKHIVHRSVFVHANFCEGGHASVRLFVQLVRTLRKQGKVGIAQYAMKNITPRLVALVPSPGVAAVGQRTVPEASLPTQGLGFYMVPLPYADDLYPVPDLATLPSRIKGVSPKCHPDVVVAEDLFLAKQVIDALSVRYDLLAVPNPSLQRQHQALEELFLRRAPLSKPGQANERPLSEFSPCTAPTPATTRHMPSSIASGGDVLNGCVGWNAVRDWTLPDKAAMARHAQRFADFNTFVLGAAYDAAEMCGQPPATTGAPRRPRACRGDVGDRKDDTWDVDSMLPSLSHTRREGHNRAQSDEKKGCCTAEEIRELARDAADRNAWHRLTVAQLKEYLRTVGYAMGHARNKDALIESAKEAFLKGKG